MTIFSASARHFRRASGVTLLAGCVVLVAGCGSGKNEYIKDVNAAQKPLMSMKSEKTPSSLAGAVPYLEKNKKVMQGVYDDFDKIEPPSGCTKVHDGIKKSIKKVVTDFDAAIAAAKSKNQANLISSTTTLSIDSGLADTAIGKINTDC